MYVKYRVLDSTLKVYIDRALLILKERGEIQKLKDIWWKEKRGGGKCGVRSNTFYCFLYLKLIIHLHLLITF